MGVFSEIFSRFQRSARAINPAHEDVDSAWLKIDESRHAVGAEGDDEVVAGDAGAGLRDKPVTRPAKAEPQFGSAAPAAIPVPEGEMSAIQRGEWGSASQEQEELLQQLNELGFNLKRAMSVVQQMQHVIEVDFDSLTAEDKQETREFIAGLSGLVINDEPSQQAA